MASPNVIRGGFSKVIISDDDDFETENSEMAKTI